MGKGREYTPDEIEAGLLALAKTGGNTHRAADVLKVTGPRAIRQQELSRLRRERPERYETICKDVWPEIERTVKQGFVDFVAQAQETQALALEQTHKQLKAGEAKNPAQVAKDLTIATGIAFDKWQLAEGKPTSIQGSTSADELLSKLQRLAPAFNGAVVDGTAEEVPNELPNELPAPPSQPVRKQGSGHSLP